MLLVVALFAVGTEAGSMMRRHSSPKDKAPLQASLQTMLADVAAERLFEVEESVRPTYEAFPKNAMGQIPPREIFPAIVRNYFTKEHGWLIKGLEPPSMTPALTEVHEAQIVRDKAPVLAAALKQVHDADQGLSLSDVVGTIAALEYLVLNEATPLLKGAYWLNGASETSVLDDATMHDVLQSYLLLFRHGAPRNLTNIGMHRRMKARAQQGDDWSKLVDFESQALKRAGLQDGAGSFDMAVHAAKDLMRGFGKWQDSECMQMKSTLLSLGSQDGSVTFEAFHAEPIHAVYQFTESAEYLRKTGTLVDESQARVVIANYLLGPSNCIASSEYSSVCCLSECEGLVSQIERKVQAPAWPADRLHAFISELPSSSVEAPRELSQALTESLFDIAHRHEGMVPVHSADFKRWLHDAFPNECPLPTAAESAAEESELAGAKEWLEVQQQCTRLPAWHPAMQPHVEGELMEV